MNKKKKYLVCPLNWGLGHASRTIPVIYELLQENHTVIIGGDGFALEILKQAFPKLDSIQIKDYRVNFSHKVMLFNLIKLIPKIILRSFLEHKTLNKLISNNNIDAVISDNRYGLWSKKVHSIIITHQLMVKLPGLFKYFEYITHLIIKRAINQFDECWIPDNGEKMNYSGDLSHKYPLPSHAKFIGIQSRFRYTHSADVKVKYDVVAILSGPEPQKTKLQSIIRKLLADSELRCLIIVGNPTKDTLINNHNEITIINHLPAEELKAQLKSAKIVISRSGYTSIMDFIYLNLQAILIPTPGQTEQEYLASFLKGRFNIVMQHKLSIEEIFNFINK